MKVQPSVEQLYAIHQSVMLVGFYEEHRARANHPIFKYFTKPCCCDIGELILGDNAVLHKKEIDAFGVSFYGLKEWNSLKDDYILNSLPSNHQFELFTC